MPPTPVTFSQEDRQMITLRASEGVPAAEIANALNVTKRMLQYRCRKELTEGYEIAKVNGVKLHGREGQGCGVTVAELTLEERKQVQIMAGYGLRNDQIAHIMGMGKMTLIAHYQDDLTLGRAEAHKNVAKSLYEMAIDKEHPSMTQFYLKAQAGWRETTSIEFPDEDGNPQRLGSNVNINLSSEKMIAIISLLNERV